MKLNDLQDLLKLYLQFKSYELPDYHLLAYLIDEYGYYTYKNRFLIFKGSDIMYDPEDHAAVYYDGNDFEEVTEHNLRRSINRLGGKY